MSGESTREMEGNMLGEELLEHDLGGGNLKVRYVSFKETVSRLCMRRNQRRKCENRRLVEVSS